MTDIVNRGPAHLDVGAGQGGNRLAKRMNKWDRTSFLRNLPRRALYLVILLLLPGAFIVLPLLWWRRHYKLRRPADQPKDIEAGVNDSITSHWQ